MSKMYQKGYKKWMLIISLLALNIMEQAAGAISATIPQMAKAFPRYSLVQVELSTTVVSIFVTIFVLTSGFITTKIGQKQTALLGMTIATIAALIPAFANSLILVIISRAIMGIGIGLANPLAISLISEFFTDQARANLLGWRSSIAALGVAFMTFGAGHLLEISWHAAYLVYLLFIPALILFYIYVPEPEKYGVRAKAEAIAAKKNHEPEHKAGLLVVLGLTLVLFLYMVTFMIAYIKIATLYVQQGIGTPTQASTALSVLNISQLLSGALFGPLYKVLHEKILYLGMFATALPLIGMAMTTNGNLILLLFVVIGAIGGLALPYFFIKISDVTTAKNAPLFNGIVLVGSNLGSFAAPFYGQILGGTTAATAFRNGGIVLTALTVIVMLVMGVLKHMHKSSEKVEV